MKSGYRPPEPTKHRGWASHRGELCAKNGTARRGGTGIRGTPCGASLVHASPGGDTPCDRCSSACSLSGGRLWCAFRDGTASHEVSRRCAVVAVAARGRVRVCGHSRSTPVASDVSPCNGRRLCAGDDDEVPLHLDVAADGSGSRGGADAPRPEIDDGRAAAGHRPGTRMAWRQRSPERHDAQGREGLRGVAAKRRMRRTERGEWERSA